MKCPSCEQPMQFGRVTVKGTFWGFVFAGLSHENLYFKRKPQPGEKTTDNLVVDSGDHRDAWQCEPCQITTIDRTGKLRPPRDPAEALGNWWAKYR